jgi:hypothetical protein
MIRAQGRGLVVIDTVLETEVGRLVGGTGMRGLRRV